MLSRPQKDCTPRGLVAAVALTGALGCASMSPPLTPLERGGAAWSELTSKHFVLDTDLAKEEAREALLAFEGIFTSFQDVAFSADIEPRTRIRVVLFGRKQDYRLFGAEQTSGYFVSSLPHDLDSVPTLVMWGSLVDYTRFVFQHELAHLFVRWSLGPTPRWLNEGLAQYYSTFELRDGAAILGKPLPHAGISTGGRWRATRAGPEQRVLIPIGSVPSVAQIIAGGYDEFNAADGKAPPTIDDSKKQMAYYLGAWGLVHLLYSAPAYRARFNAVVSAVAQGKSVGEAWAARFDDIALDKLDADFREHLIRTELIEAQAWKTAYTPRPAAPVEMERALSPADIHLLWARLRDWNDATEREVHADLDAARALDPRSPEVQFWSGLWHLEGGRLREAEAALDAALEQRPNDARYLMARAMVYFRGWKGGEAPPPGGFDEILKRLEKVAVSSRALNFVATYYASKRAPDEGLRFAARAIKSDPACFHCYATRARLLFGKRLFAEAVVSQQRALNLLPDGVTAPSLLRDLKRYKEAREHAPPEEKGEAGQAP